MKNLFFCIIMSMLPLMSHASHDANDIVTYKSTFSKTDHYFVSYADYPKGQESFYELNFKPGSKLPSEIRTKSEGLKISGNNHSDDLFMYAYTKISGLSANTTYHVSFSLEFASNATSDMGVGGSPGESVFVKIGAVAKEPQRYVDDNGFYRMTLDKGNQMQDGKDMILIGTAAVNTRNELYMLKNLPYQPDSLMQEKLANYSVTTNDKGDVWLILGTDSGFESTSTFIYTNVVVTFSKTLQ